MIVPPTSQQQLNLSHTWRLLHCWRCHHGNCRNYSITRWHPPVGSTLFQTYPALAFWFNLLSQRHLFGAASAACCCCCCYFSRGDIKDINKSCHLIRQHRWWYSFILTPSFLLYQLPLSVSCSCSSPTPPALTIISIINAAHWLAQFCSALIRNIVDPPSAYIALLPSSKHNWHIWYLLFAPNGSAIEWTELIELRDLFSRATPTIGA